MYHPPVYKSKQVEQSISAVCPIRWSAAGPPSKPKSPAAVAPRAGEPSRWCGLEPPGFIRQTSFTRRGKHGARTSTRLLAYYWCPTWLWADRYPEYRGAHPSPGPASPDIWRDQVGGQRSVGGGGGFWQRARACPALCRHQRALGLSLGRTGHTVTSSQPSVSYYTCVDTPVGPLTTYHILAIGFGIIALVGIAWPLLQAIFRRGGAR